jgi:hypothetical protein
MCHHKYLALAFGTIALASVLTSTAGNAAGVTPPRPLITPPKVTVPPVKLTTPMQPARVNVPVERPGAKAAALVKPQLQTANSAHPTGGTSYNPDTNETITWVWHPGGDVGGGMKERPGWQRIVEPGNTTGNHKF